MLPYITIGKIQLPMYGICILAGAVLAMLLALRRAKRTRIQSDDLLYSVCYTVIGAMLGAKILYVITAWDTVVANADYYFGSFAGFREFFGYGFVFYGGLIGGLIVFIPYCVRHKLDLGDMIALIIPCVPLVHAIGRIGCFCAGCCYGIPMDPPWGVCFQSPLAPQGVSLFPVQLLESALNLILFAFLFTYTRKPRKPGAILGWYLICYGVERFALEYLRYDEIRGFVFGISTSQLISLILIPVGVALVMIRFEKKIGMSSPAGVDAYLLRETVETSVQEPAAQDASQADAVQSSDAETDAGQSDDAQESVAGNETEESAGETDADAPVMPQESKTPEAEDAHQRNN